MTSLLDQSENQYINLFGNALEGYWESSPNGQCTMVDETLAQLYGYTSRDQLFQAFNNNKNHLYVDITRKEEFIVLLYKNKSLFGFESQVQRLDGKIIWISEDAKPVRDEADRIIYYQMSVKDITEIVKQRSEPYYSVYYDSITQLPNRTFLLQQLTRVIESPSDSKEFCLIILDVDRINLINSGFGLDTVSQVLKDISGRLKKVIQSNQLLTHLRSNEFAILIKNSANLVEIINLVEKIQKVFHEPLNIHNYHIFTNVNIGIVYSPFLNEKISGSSISPETIVNHANSALQESKYKAKGSYHIFKPMINYKNLSQIKIETDLHKAIPRHEFELYYQPIVDIYTQKTQGFEALLRWNHPQQGVVSPPDFLMAAEDSGFIISLGNWILQEAVNQLVQWQQETQNRNIFVSVNISAKQFANSELASNIQYVLDHYDMFPGSLQLEITENCFISDKELATSKLLQIKEKGIKISLDDFGTGHSNFNYLYELPIDIIKLDRLFIGEITTNSIKAKIARSILDFANDLSILTIAEGIETKAQLEQLKTLKCQMTQGYLFAKPMKAEDALDYILKNS